MNTQAKQSTGPITPQRMEEAGLNATAVREQQLYDGWLMRWAPSKARRARSISVLGSAALPLEEKLQYAQGVYMHHEQPLLFRLPSACIDATLAPALKARGYAALERVLVMAARIGQPMNHLASAPSAQNALRYHIATPAEFAAQVGRMNGTPETQIDEHARRLVGIALPTLPLLAFRGDACLGAALAVYDDKLMGVFDVVTDSTHRRQGIATALMRQLIHAAPRYGAEQAYLQVAQTNTVARAVYEQQGYTVQYHYEYWGENGNKQ